MNLKNEKFFNTMYNHDEWINKEFEIKEYYNKKSIKKTLGGDEMNFNLFSNKLGNKFLNPFSLGFFYFNFFKGNYLNHPSHPYSDNVIQSRFIVDLKFPIEYLEFIPNKYFKKPKLVFLEDGFMKCVVFIAKRKLINEELFIDYQKNPFIIHEDWYQNFNFIQNSKYWSII
jgi:hypothetical protein